MRSVRRLAAVVMIFLLAIPTKSIAAEGHTHSLVPSIGPVTTSSSEEYCSITSYTVTQKCNCGYKVETEQTEYVPHQWESVCVDRVRNGYQNRCKVCRRTKGAIVYEVVLMSRKRVSITYVQHDSE